MIYDLFNGYLILYMYAGNTFIFGWQRMYITGVEFEEICGVIEVPCMFLTGRSCIYVW